MSDSVVKPTSLSTFFRKVFHKNRNINLNKVNKSTATTTTKRISDLSKPHAIPNEEQPLPLKQQEPQRQSAVLKPATDVLEATKDQQKQVRTASSDSMAINNIPEIVSINVATHKRTESGDTSLETNGGMSPGASGVSAISGSSLAASPNPNFNGGSRPSSYIGSIGTTGTSAGTPRGADSASVLTLASSSKGRRKSLDTNASIQGVFSESIFSKAESVESEIK